MKKLLIFFLMIAIMLSGHAYAEEELLPFTIMEFQYSVPASWQIYSDNKDTPNAIYRWHDRDDGGSLFFYASGEYPEIPGSSDRQAKNFAAAFCETVLEMDAAPDIDSILLETINGCRAILFDTAKMDVESEYSGLAVFIGQESIMTVASSGPDSLEALTSVYKTISSHKIKAQPDTSQMPNLAVFDASAPDLSALSFDELIALRELIDMALWQTDEWQEVVVPIGVYEVGVDIPAGHWNISVPDGEYTVLTWAKELDESGKDCEWDAKLYSTGIMSKTFGSYDKFGDSYPEIIDLDLADGTYIIVEDGSVVFTPYTGKPDLGFK